VTKILEDLNNAELRHKNLDGKVKKTEQTDEKVTFLAETAMRSSQKGQGCTITDRYVREKPAGEALSKVT